MTQRPVAVSQVLAHIIGMGDAAQQPRHFTTTVSQAIPQALANARLSSADVDYYEINEAFSVVDLVNRDILGLDDDRCLCPSWDRLHVASLDAAPVQLLL